jgi:trigger factor
VKIEVKTKEGLERELNVQIPAETVKSEMDKKLTELRKTVTLKGFRKGKAPMEMIRAHYSDQVKGDVIDELFRQSLMTAVEENKLRIAGRPTVTDLDLGDDGSMAYTANLEVFPEVERVGFEGIELPRIDIAVEDKEVDDIVEAYRKQFSESRVVERAAADGDVILADLVKTADPKNALEVDKFPDSKIDLGNPATIKEFKEQLPGLKAGDEKEIVVVYDEDYSDEHFAGAHITYKVVVKEVTERILPEFDDALAKRTGMAETALELKLKVRQRLLEEKESSQKRGQKRVLVDQVCAKNQVPIPEGVVAEYLDNMVKDFKERGEDHDEKEIRERFRPIGVKSMRWDLLWRKLVEQEKIEVLPEDTEKWITGFAAYNGVTPEQATESLRKAGKIAELRDSILEDKALDFLMGKVTFVPAK